MLQCQEPRQSSTSRGHIRDKLEAAPWRGPDRDLYPTWTSLEGKIVLAILGPRFGKLAYIDDVANAESGVRVTLYDYDSNTMPRFRRRASHRRQMRVAHPGLSYEWYVYPGDAVPCPNCASDKLRMVHVCEFCGTASRMPRGNSLLIRDLKAPTVRYLLPGDIEFTQEEEHYLLNTPGYLVKVM